MADCDAKLAEYLDLGSSELAEKSFCHRIFCWPCDCTSALCAALSSRDGCGALRVLFCCPCRTCCGWCPTDAEGGTPPADDEPEEIPYARVFEMEKKKREKLKATAQ